MGQLPMEFDQAIADIICERIAGGESLRAICDDKSLPCNTTVRKWLRGNAEFARQYAGAREDQADALADEMLDTARQEPGSNMNGVDQGEVAHRRLQIDVLKWRAGKLRPKVYGDKIQQEITGTLSLEQLVAGTVKPPEDRA